MKAALDHNCGRNISQQNKNEVPTKQCQFLEECQGAPTYSLCFHSGEAVSKKKKKSGGTLKTTQLSF